MPTKKTSSDSLFVFNNPCLLTEDKQRVDLVNSEFNWRGNGKTHGRRMQFLVYYASHFSGRGVPGILIWISCCFLKLTAVENWLPFCCFLEQDALDWRALLGLADKKGEWLEEQSWIRQSIECMHQFDQFDQVAKLLVCAEGAFHFKILEKCSGGKMWRSNQLICSLPHQMFTSLNSLSIKRLLSETSMRRQNSQVMQGGFF